MAMLSWMPNIYVVNDNQTIFSAHIGIHGDKMVHFAAKQRKSVQAFSVNSLRDSWARDPSTAHLAKVKERASLQGSEKLQDAPLSWSLVNSEFRLGVRKP